MHVMRMCQALAALGHEVTLHARAGADAVLDDHAHYGVARTFRIVKHPRPQLRVIGALVNAGHVRSSVRRAHCVDLVYAREVYGLAAVAKTGVPFIYESHWKPKHSVQKALEGWLFRLPNCRRVVVISSALRDIYRKEFPWLDQGKLVVAHDAADPVEFTTTRPTAGPLRVGYVGGFLPGYGIELVVDLARRLPTVEFHIVGGKGEQVRSWRLRTAGMSNLVLHGFVAPGHLSEVYQTLDVMLAPYQEDTSHLAWISPMKLFEYMAHGKAIVCSDFPVMREVLTDEHDALLVPAASVARWVVAIERLRDSTLREALAGHARQKLEEQFTWRRRAQLVLGEAEPGGGVGSPFTAEGAGG